MADGVKIDFSALKNPDYVGSYINAFKVGQAMSRQTAARATTAGNAMSGGAEGADQALRARIAGMSAAERTRASEQADLLAAVGQSLKSVAYTQRPAVLAHMTPALAARGVPASAIRAFDPTDENLDAAVASARSTGAMLGAADPATES